MVDLIGLKDFLVLCEARSFSRAAERCHVSVSGLSRRIQALEQWLGVPVFERHKAALEITPAGHRLQAVASEVVYALEGLRKSIKSDRDDRQLRIRFAAPHIMSAVFFPDWIPRLHSDFATARFSVDSDNLPDCVGRLVDGDADFVVGLFDDDGTVEARLGMPPRSTSFLRIQLGDERLIPVSAPNPAGRPRFDLDRHGAEPLSFLAYAPECHLGWSLAPRLRAEPSLKLQAGHSASLTDGLRCMALAGLGVAWLPQSLVARDLDARRLVRAGEARFDVRLRLVLMRSQQPLGGQAERLWRHLGELACPPKVLGEPPLFPAEAVA